MRSGNINIKIKTCCMLFIIFFTLFIVINSINAEAKTDPLSIRVAINTGYLIELTNIEPIEDAIDGYNWVVNNTEYVIDTYRINIIDIINGNLTTDNYDVHIIDGVTDKVSNSMIATAKPLQIVLCFIFKYLFILYVRTFLYKDGDRCG
jgi:hypothetical protein